MAGGTRANSFHYKKSDEEFDGKTSTSRGAEVGGCHGDGPLQETAQSMLPDVVDQCVSSTTPGEPASPRLCAAPPSPHPATLSSAATRASELCCVQRRQVRSNWSLSMSAWISPGVWSCACFVWVCEVCVRRETCECVVCVGVRCLSQQRRGAGVGIVCFVPIIGRKH